MDFFSANGLLQCYICEGCGEHENGVRGTCPPADKPTQTVCLKIVLMEKKMARVLRGCTEPKNVGCHENNDKGRRLVACDSDLCNAGPVGVCSSTTTSTINFWNILMCEEFVEWLLLMYAIIAVFVMVHY